MQTAEYISFTINRFPKGYVFTYADFTKWNDEDVSMLTVSKCYTM